MSDEGLIVYIITRHSMKLNRSHKTRIPQGQGFLFTFRPTPSCRFSLICGPQSVPRPRAWEERAVRPICGCGLSYDLPSSHRPVPSHSLAARSTTRN